MMYQEKEDAIERIKRTPELRQLRHLEKTQWRDCSPFWNWISSAPASEILKTSYDLTPSSLKRIAYHEAGHVMASYLTYMNVLSATIIPSVDGHVAGEVITEADSVKSSKNSIYLAWRTVVGWIAGPAAEDRFRKTVLDGFDADIAKSISYIRLVEDLPYQKNLLSTALIGAVVLLSNKTVWGAVEEIAKLLLRYGTISEEEISNVVDKNMQKAVNVPKIVKIIQKLENGAFPNGSPRDLFKGNSDKAISITYPIDSYTSNRLFNDEMIPFLDYRPIDISRKFHDMVFQNSYWGMDLDWFLQVENGIRLFESCVDQPRIR